MVRILFHSFLGTIHSSVLSPSALLLVHDPPLFLQFWSVSFIGIPLLPFFVYYHPPAYSYSLSLSHSRCPFPSLFTNDIRSSCLSFSLCPILYSLCKLTAVMFIHLPSLFSNAMNPLHFLPRPCPSYICLCVIQSTSLIYHRITIPISISATRVQLTSTELAIAVTSHIC